MNPIVINGTVLCDPITGIPRFVYEVVTRLDPLLDGTGLDVRLCYRDDGRPLHLPELKNIKIVPLKAIKYSYNLVVLPRFPTLIVCACVLVAALLLFISGVILSSQLTKDDRDFEFHLQQVQQWKNRSADPFSHSAK